MNPRIKKTPKGASKSPSPAELLARMPRRPMTAEQQAVALEKVQQQATQRIKLGQQLFEAADAKLKQHQELLKDIQGQQQILRDQVQEDVAKSLQSYDQWMGKIDESFTDAVRKLNDRIDQLELRVDASRGELESMIEKATALMSQTQGLMADAFESNASSDDREVSQQIAAEMQQSIPEDAHCDIDALCEPPLIEFEPEPIDTAAVMYETDADVFEVEIVTPAEPTEISSSDISPVARQAAEASEPTEFDEGDLQGSAEEDDVFGEVLRRLRQQVEDDDQDAAA